MARFFRLAGLAVMLSACAIVDGFAQTEHLVFTVAVPERTSPETVLRASAVVEERGLALWSGGASDFGVGVTLSGPQWTVRSITSMTTLPIGRESRPTFQQIEIVRPVFSTGSISVVGGGGIREEWDGTRTLIGRLFGGSDVARGRLQGSLVIERAVASPIKRDAADVITSLGWSRRVGDRISVGVEGIGQDLEGLWNPAEAEGGAKLLVGPSLHAQSRHGDWAASLVAGPVVHPTSAAPAADVVATRYPNAGRHFGIFASAIWTPSLSRRSRVAD